ncbi:MAG: hypothetical protein ACXWRU_19465 [Pseudobdellovibrionaceae bacterium]
MEYRKMKIHNVIKLCSKIVLSIMLISCVSIKKSPDLGEPLKGPNVRSLKFNFDGWYRSPDFDKRFYNEGLVTKNDQGIDLDFNYKECLAVFDGIAKRILNSFLPIITFGFVPHRMDYSCPLRIDVKRDDQVIGRYQYEIPVQTSASIYELFRSIPAVEYQLNDERFRYTKRIFSEKLNQELQKLTSKSK